MLYRQILSSALLLIQIVLFHSIDFAQTHRAFLVGIDKYNFTKTPESPCPRSFDDLKGCINDVEEMAALLESKYGFTHENIHILTNENATRDNIISQFTKYLVAEANPNDICVFFYSGHGSFVKNSKSTEHDGYDESIVPADSYLGTKDIRDKELKKLFNAVLDKQAGLTVFMDSCYSGSISRGIPTPLRYKFLPPNECDVADPPDSTERPSKRGAIIFTACQDADRAEEFTDKEENDQDKKDHGLFTWALLEVLRTTPIDEPAQNIILRTNALMHSEGKTQEPNLECREDLRMNPLFGIKPGTRSKVTAAVVRIEEGEIILQGGIAAGIRENCELKYMSNNRNTSEIRLKITSAEGLNRSRAKLISGNIHRIQPGDLYEMVKWASPPTTRLKNWIPFFDIPASELERTAGNIKKMCETNRIEWITDPTEINPQFTMSRENAGWILTTPSANRIDLGKTPSTTELLKHIRANLSPATQKPGFFFQVPLGSESEAFIRKDLFEYNDTVEFLSSPADAHYILAGRFNAERIEYAWILPNTIQEKEKPLPLPVRTEWIPFEKPGITSDCFFQLREQIVRLALIRGWQQLSTPPDVGEFPYRLTLQKTGTNDFKTTGPLTEGEKYDPVLVGNETKLAPKTEKRYVYVFVIDSYGKGTLLFPLRDVFNSENRFPVESSTPPSKIVLSKGGLFDIYPPFGVDTYILLTTAEPISNPDVLNFSGVRRGEPKGELSPLEKLLMGVGLTRSGETPVTPTHWSIERLSIQSKPK